MVTAVGLGFFTLMADKTWPLRVTQVSSWLGFWAMNDWYSEFPTNVNTTLTNVLLVLAGNRAIHGHARGGTILSQVPSNQPLGDLLLHKITTQTHFLQNK